MDSYDTSKKSITLVAYRKTDDYFTGSGGGTGSVTISTNSSTGASSSSSTTMGSETQSETASRADETAMRLQLIKAELAKGSSSSASASASSTPVPPAREAKSVKGAAAKVANAYAHSASDLLFAGDRQQANETGVDLKQVSRLPFGFFHQLLNEFVTWSDCLF